MGAKFEFSRLTKAGLLLTLFSWLSYTTYRFMLSITTVSILETDVPAVVGLGSRMVAALMAVSTLLYYYHGDLLSPEAVKSWRWSILFEAIYFFSFLPSGLWGMVVYTTLYPRELLVTSTGLPCLVEAIVIPIVLILFFKRLTQERGDIKIKWSFISVTVYVLVFWFNYTMQWVASLYQNGTVFLSHYPVNMLGFALTAFGLLILGLYIASFTRKISENVSRNLLLKKVGIVLTAFGLYFDIIYLLWILFGSIGGWNMWHTFFVYHNVDLWMLTLPLVGLPLLIEAGRHASKE